VARAIRAMSSTFQRANVFMDRQAHKSTEIGQMTITLNHTIVPARDKEAAAQTFAELFGLSFE